MSTLSNRAIVAFAIVALGAGSASAISACGSSSSGEVSSKDSGTQGTGPGTGTMGEHGDAGIGTVSTTAGACPNPTVQLIFSPMYSAFIPGSTEHAFSIPAVTADGNPATWSLSDPTQANLQLQSFQNGADLVPGVLITVAGAGNDAGQVTVIATESGGACGTSVLSVTQNTVSDWMTGSSRYNNGTALMPICAARRRLPRVRREHPRRRLRLRRQLSRRVRVRQQLLSFAGCDEHRRGGRRHRLHELPRPDRDKWSLQDGFAYAGADGGIQRHGSREHHPEWRGSRWRVLRPHGPRPELRRRSDVHGAGDRHLALLSQVERHHTGRAARRDLLSAFAHSPGPDRNVELRRLLPP